MCGLNLIFAYREEAPPVSENELITVRERMRLRGPDAAGLWVSTDRRVGFGHRRLSIIDIGGGAQPMFARANHPQRQLVVIFNGEIYNYPSLRAELSAQGYTFRTRSDTEVLLHLYDRDGPAMLDKLRGMFAFALWDNAKRAILLARDHFGIKPLYYADDGQTLRAASQVKALCASTALDQAPDPAGHVGFFLLGTVPEPYTLYRNIHALPAGHYLWIERDGIPKIHPFFDARSELAETVTAMPLSPPEVQERLHTLIADSVRHHLLADVPVGIFLSAGQDSCALASLAREQKHIALNTVTLGFQEYKGTVFDETILAEEVATQLLTHHKTRWVSRDDFLAERENLMHHMDQPSIDGVNSYFVSKVTAQIGLKVAISGVGGDELFASYPSFSQIPRLVRRLRFLRGAPWVGKLFRIVTADLARRFTSPKYAGVLEYGSRYGSAYLLRRGFFMPWELPSCLEPELVREGWRRLELLLHLERSVEGLPTPRHSITALEFNWYLRNQLLRDADWAGMAHSLEIRTPLVDIAVFRAILPLLSTNPNDLRKSTLLGGLRRSLPPAILNRRKTGFSVPVYEWLQADSPSRERGLRGWGKMVYRDFLETQ